MKKIKKLNNGNEIPVLGFGTWQIWDQKVAAESVRNALEIGYKHIDTAEVYENEEGVGQGIKDSKILRKDLFLTTKVWTNHCTFKRAKEALYKSLERLNTDYVDLHLIHWPTVNTMVETWQALEELQKEGVTKNIGFSNFNSHHIDEILKYAKVVPQINQVECHPVFQQKSLRAYCLDKGIAVEAWAPLVKGSFFTNETVLEIAKKYGVTAAQVILNFEISEGLIVLPKSIHKERIEENFKTLDFMLDKEDIEKMRALDTGKRLFRDPDNHGFSVETESVNPNK